MTKNFTKSEILSGNMSTSCDMSHAVLRKKAKRQSQRQTIWQKGEDQMETKRFVRKGLAVLLCLSVLMGATGLAALALPEGTQCTVTDNGDGTVHLKPTQAGGYALTEETFTFNPNAAGLTFPGTSMVIPEKMLAITLKKAGDLSGVFEVRVEGSLNYGGFMLRDVGTEESPKVRLSHRRDNEWGSNVKECSYAYGKRVLLWMRYHNDVNRWCMAVEQQDGTFVIYDSEDFHAMLPTLGTADVSPKKLNLFFHAACEGVDIKAATPDDIDQNVDPDSVTVKNVTSTDLEGGRHTLTATAEGGTVRFNNALRFAQAEGNYAFRGTRYKIPNNAIYLSIAKSGDLKSWMSLKFNNCPDDYGWLMLRDIGPVSQDGATTVLRFSNFQTSENPGTVRDIPYAYGKPIYVWVDYKTDVNRWGVAIGQQDGTFAVRGGVTPAAEDRGDWYGDADWHSLKPTGGTADTSARMPLLTFSTQGSTVTAGIVKAEAMEKIVLSDIFTPITMTDNGDGYDMSSEGNAAYTFPEKLTFEPTSQLFMATSQNIPEHALRLTLQSDSFAGWFGVRALADEDPESAGIKTHTLMLRINKDNGDGTGELKVTIYLDREERIVLVPYRFGEPLYVYPRMCADVHRWTLATPNLDGLGYYNVSDDWWRAEDPYVNTSKPYEPYRLSVITSGALKNATVKAIGAEEVKEVPYPPVDISKPFIGNLVTTVTDENGYYNLTVGDYAKSTFQVDLTKGLIFRPADIKDWLSLRVDSAYWTMPGNPLGGDSNTSATVLLKKNDGQNMWVSLWNGSTEILGKALDGVSPYSTHLLTVHRVTTDPVGIYYKLMIDGKTIVDGLSIMEDDFKKLNNYDEETDTFKGAYIRFGTSGGTAQVNGIREFKPGKEVTTGDWTSNTGATAQKLAEGKYALALNGYTSARLNMQAELATGVTLDVTELEAFGQFGIAFGMLKNSVSLGIPPTVDANAIYYLFSDNGDGTFRVTDSRGAQADYAGDLRHKHVYSLRPVETSTGETVYSLAIDGTALFAQGLSFMEYICVNNGNVGAFPTLFTKAAVSIGEFSGKFTKKVSDQQNDDDWNDDDWDDPDDNGDPSDDNEDPWDDPDDNGDPGESPDDNDDPWEEPIDPALPDEPVTPATDPDDGLLYEDVLVTVKMKRGSAGGNYWWIWAIGGGVIALAGGGTAAWLLISRKKRRQAAQAEEMPTSSHT